MPCTWNSGDNKLKAGAKHGHEGKQNGLPCHFTGSFTRKGIKTSPLHVSKNNWFLISAMLASRKDVNLCECMCKRARDT